MKSLNKDNQNLPQRVTIFKNSESSQYVRMISNRIDRNIHQIVSVEAV